MRGTLSNDFLGKATSLKTLLMATASLAEQIVMTVLCSRDKAGTCRALWAMICSITR